MAQDASSIPVSVRQLRPVQPHPESCRWTSSASRRRLYGVSETRILNLLHNAYSQNYVYLIKKPNDQYQVILEVADDQRSEPQDLHLLYIKSDDGQRMVPLNAVTTWHR